jgi:hypothetical protein
LQGKADLEPSGTQDGIELSTSLIDSALHGRIADQDSLGQVGRRSGRLILQRPQNPRREFGRHYLAGRLDFTNTFGSLNPMRQRGHATTYLIVVSARRAATVADCPAPLIRKLLRRVRPSMLKPSPNLYFDREALDLRYNMHGSIAMAGPDPTIIDARARESVNEPVHQFVLSSKPEFPNDTNAN